jgi:hypothetical protein
MKKIFGVLFSIAFVAVMYSIGVTGSTGIKCQTSGGKTCVCVAGDSSKCKDKYKDVFSCVANQDVSGKDECEKK